MAAQTTEATRSRPASRLAGALSGERAVQSAGAAHSLASFARWSRTLRVIH